MKSPFSAGDFYQGIGGGSLGLQRSGFKVLAALDFDADACNTYKINLGIEPIQQNIKNVKGSEFLAHYGLKKGDLDLLIGCPPCQGFSSLRRTRYPSLTDSRKSLVRIFSDRVEEIEPKAVIFENVVGIIGLKNRQYFRRYLTRLKKLGYETSWNVFDTADFGIPQHRKRVVALSIQGITKPKLPDLTHAKPSSNNNLIPWRTVRDTISRLPKLEAGESDPRDPNHKAKKNSLKVAAKIKKIPKDGGSRKDLPKSMWLSCHLKLGKREGAGNIYGRLWWDKPSGTMTCRCTSPSSGRFIHPDQDRAITPREAGLLQSFPSTFNFPAANSLAEKQIGNAVPPEFIARFAAVIKDYL